MYIHKNDLIQRLASITGKSKKELNLLTVAELSEMYKQYESKEGRVYLNVPYKDKDTAKLLGAKYDGELKKWYVPQGVTVERFDKWLVK